MSGDLKNRIDRLYRDNQSPILHYILKSIRDEGVAADILQDTFLNFFRIFQNRPLPATDEECRMYLYRTARNLLINHERSYYNRQVFRSPSTEDLPLSPENDETPEQQTLSRETENEVQLLVGRLLESLEEIERSAILLRYYSGLSFQEISEILEMTLSSTFRLVKKAEKHLRDAGKKFRGEEKLL